MSLEPELPIEFIVQGVAISVQGSRSSIETWKRAIREAVRQALPEGYWLLTAPVAVAIFLFPRAPLRGDIDNRVKPILDAMSGHVFSDDALVERLVVQKFEPGLAAGDDYPTTLLRSAFEAKHPLIYVRITGKLDEGWF
ncbi:MAG TPA: RusA family crossover junction endodeoxyribonuclease [Methylocystis sp.]|nr:RusA family crossover junction endodeoxyribonuclease [Methylocystis sp.]